MYTGPHLIKDNLVFAYDTGYGVADNNTATRFYPGKAVDNEFYNSGDDGTILDYVGYGGTGTARSGVLDALGTTGNTVYLKTGKLRFGPTNGDDIGTLYYGNTYTFSIYMRHVPGYPQMSGGEFDICDRINSKSYSGTLSSNMTYEWKRFSVTAVHNNNANYHFIDVGVYQSTGVFEWCCPQIERGTIASPFTSTERLDTASLIDLKRTTSIDVSNVSFDSTGQPTFDGTDDILNTGLLSGRNPATDPFTIEAIVKSDTTSGARMWLDATSNGTSQRLYCAHAATGTGNPMGIQNSGWSSSGVHDTNFHHYVIVMDGSTATLYNNGVVHSTKSYSSYGIQALNVGGRNSYRWNGPIPVFKIHNQVLSANQVKQNYSTYKNRFGI